MKRNLLIGPFLLIMLWALLSYLGFVKTVFLPEPHIVLLRLSSVMITGEVLPDIIATIYRLLVGFLLGVAISVPMGLLMGYYRPIYDSMEALVDFFRSVPVTSLFPLFLLFFGIGDAAKIAMAAWSSGLLVLVNTMYGVRHASDLRRTVAMVMKATPRKMFLYVVFPDALPNIFVGLRTGISLGLIVIVVAEMFMGTRTGLGQLIYNSSLLYDTSLMYSAIIITGMIGYLVNKCVLMLEHRYLHWVGR